MARFAHTAMTRVQALTRALEASLGPGTSELAMRCGMHSGPVTAGVLRGEKSRFQLFGDTMVRSFFYGAVLACRLATC
jgi:class 3 adenylate cyclase